MEGPCEYKTGPVGGGGLRRGRVVCLSRNMWRGRGDKVDEYK